MSAQVSFGSDEAFNFFLTMKTPATMDTRATVVIRNPIRTPGNVKFIFGCSLAPSPCLKETCPLESSQQHALR